MYYDILELLCGLNISGVSLKRILCPFASYYEAVLIPVLPESIHFALPADSLQTPATIASSFGITPFPNSMLSCSIRLILHVESKSFQLALQRLFSMPLG